MGEMDEDFFELLERTARTGGAAATFDLLISKFIEQGNYPLVFEARLMRQRHVLGLPLIHNGAISDLPPEAQPAYQSAMVEAARETGGLFLADGDVVRAWPYFRAIGEPGPVAAAIDRIQPAENLDGVLQIALQEGVNPKRGFELLLEHRGICPAIDYTLQCTDRTRRIEFLQMLVRRLRSDLAANLKEAIAAVEGRAPEATSISDLIAGRDWLFEGGRFYIENSHLSSIVQASRELPDEETLRLVLDLIEYALRLAPLYHFPGEPPFENLYTDHAIYLRALVGDGIDDAISHFQEKLATGTRGSAETLVALLARLGRYADALRVSLEHLAGEGSHRCPSAAELCQLSGDFKQLCELARKRGDFLAFTASLIHPRA